jgi:hypothetical protein
MMITTNDPLRGRYEDEAIAARQDAPLAQRQDDTGGRPARRGCTIEHVSKVDHAPGAQAPVPPCLHNLLFDPSHPHFFEITADHLAHPHGTPGSCMDQLKTHVRDTLGAEPFMRALGSVEFEDLAPLMHDALVAQGWSVDVAASKAGQMSGMMGHTALNLLQDAVAGVVEGKLTVMGAFLDDMKGDELLEKVVLARASTIHDEDLQKRFLGLFGVTESKASKIHDLLAEWIPQEITAPTAESAGDVNEALALLDKGVDRARSMVDHLLDETRYWQLGKAFDPLADFEPEVQDIFAALGLPSHEVDAGNVMGRLVDVHVDSVKVKRRVEGAVKLFMSALGPGDLLGAVGSVPGLAATKMHAQEMAYLASLGSASGEDVQAANEDHRYEIVGMLSTLILGSPVMQTVQYMQPATAP